MNLFRSLGTFVQSCVFASYSWPLVECVGAPVRKPLAVSLPMLKHIHSGFRISRQGPHGTGFRGWILTIFHRLTRWAYILLTHGGRIVGMGYKWDEITPIFLGLITGFE